MFMNVPVKLQQIKTVSSHSSETAVNSCSSHTARDFFWTRNPFSEELGENTDSIEEIEVSL